MWNTSCWIVSFSTANRNACAASRPSVNAQRRSRGGGGPRPGSALPLGILQLEAIPAPELVERQIPRPATAAQHPPRARPVDVPGAVDPERDRAQARAHVTSGRKPARRAASTARRSHPDRMGAPRRAGDTVRSPIADGEREPGRRARRGKDDLPDPCPHRRLENAERAVHVRLQHLERRRPERARDRGEVDDRMRACEAPSEQLVVLEARRAEPNVVAPRPRAPDGDEFVPVLAQDLEDVRPDRPARAGDGDLHRPRTLDGQGAGPSLRGKEVWRMRSTSLGRCSFAVKAHACLGHRAMYHRCP